MPIRAHEERIIREAVTLLWNQGRGRRQRPGVVPHGPSHHHHHFWVRCNHLDAHLQQPFLRRAPAGNARARATWPKTRVDDSALTESAARGAAAVRAHTICSARGKGGSKWRSRLVFGRRKYRRRPTFHSSKRRPAARARSLTVFARRTQAPWVRRGHCLALPPLPAAACMLKELRPPLSAVSNVHCAVEIGV